MTTLQLPTIGKHIINFVLLIKNWQLVVNYVMVYHVCSQKMIMVPSKRECLSECEAELTCIIIIITPLLASRLYLSTLIITLDQSLNA